jgi:hypothetical protein
MVKLSNPPNRLQRTTFPFPPHFTKITVDLNIPQSSNSLLVGLHNLLAVRHHGAGWTATEPWPVSFRLCPSACGDSEGQHGKVVDAEVQQNRDRNQLPRNSDWTRKARSESGQGAQQGHCRDVPSSLPRNDWGHGISHVHRQ